MTVNTLGTHEPLRPSPTVAERLWQFLPAGISVLSMSALGYYHVQLLEGPVQTQSALQFLYAQIYRGIGLAPAMMFFLLVTVWSVLWYVTGTLERPLSRLGRLVAMTIMLGMFLNIGDGGVAPAANKGELGAWLAGVLIGAFGYWPSLLLVWAITFLSLLLATDFFFIDRFERARREPEQGVEVGVTDHLRRLGEMQAGSGLPTTAGPAADLRGAAAAAPTNDGSSAAFAAAVAAAAAAAEAAEHSESELADAPAAVPLSAPAVDVAGEEPRLSYSERRRAREARRWGEPVDEGWVPAPPENQEIDNPEATAGAAEPAMAAEFVADAPLEPEAPEAVLEASPAEPALPEALPERDEPAPEAAAWVGSAPQIAGFPFPSTGDAIEGRDEPALGAGLDAMPATQGEADQPTEDEPATPAEIRAAESESEAAAVEALVDIPRPEAGWRRARARADAPIVDERSSMAPAEPAPVEPRSSEPRASEPRASEPIVEVPAVEPVERGRTRQQGLFGSGVDAGLVQEAIDLVTGARRATAALLQRKLRIDYPLALELLAELAARGVVALEGDASQGRVLS